METVLAFIIIFGTLVFFHELGHFIFAKRAGILVREFAIGFGPKIVSLRKGETLYTIRILPLGGYVLMAGQDFDTIELQPGYRIGVILNDEDEIEKIYLNQNHTDPNILFLETEEADLTTDLYIKGYDEEGELVRFNVARNALFIEKGKETLIAPKDRQFEAKPLHKRAMTIFAGPLFNFILAAFLFMIIGLFYGVPTNQPVLTQVMKGSPAETAGLQAGDHIKEVDGESIDKWNEFTGIIKDNPGKELEIVIDRDGKLMTTKLVPETIKEAGAEFGQVGVAAGQVEKNPLKAIPFGVEQTIRLTKEIIGLLTMLVTGAFTIDALSGPVGIYKATEFAAQHGLVNLMNFAAILSINLGIMNLLPLPALDGGRLLFFFFEAIRGKPIDHQKEGLVHFVGIMLLMVLMVIVTWNDIQRFFF